MSSNISLALSALATKLAAVATVRTGLTAAETTSADLPIITVFSIDDKPVNPEQGRGNEYTRTAVIEYKTAVSNFGDGLDTALNLIRKALKVDFSSSAPLSAYATQLRQTGTRFFIPENNSETAIVQVTVEIDYLEYFT